MTTQPVTTRVHALLPTVLLAVFVVAGCATGPPDRSVPDWLIQPPAADEQNEYFVASATARDGDSAAASEHAAAALLTQINQALGVNVDVLTTAQARSTLDSYEANLVQQVTQAGGGRIEGLRINDRYIVEADGQVTVHLLGAYERTAFERERQARRELLRQREALLLEPEVEAARAAELGESARALLLYSQSAAAAAVAVEEGLRIAPGVLERVLQAAGGLAAGLTLETLSGPVQPMVDTPIAEPVLFLLTDRSGAPVPQAPLEISYQIRSGGRVALRTERLVTGDDGVVRFTHPSATVPGDRSVTARLDLPEVFALTDRLPESMAAQVNSLETAVANVRASYQFNVVSRAREFATAVVITDTDATGAPMPVRRTADGVREVLLQAGFTLVPAEVDYETLALLSDAELAGYLQSVLPTSVERVIVGTAGITDFSDGDGYLVRVSATLHAVDLVLGEPVHQVSGVKNAQSSSANGAITSAFLSLGRALGEELASSMP